MSCRKIGFPKDGASPRRTFLGMLVSKTCIEHRQQDPLDLEPLVQSPSDALERIQELAHALESEEFGLDGDEHRIGGRQRVHGEEAEARRAVDDHVVPTVADRSERVPQAKLPAGSPDKLDLRPGQLVLGGSEEETVELGRQDNPGERGFLDDDVVDARAVLVRADAQSARRVRLRIDVDEKGSLLGDRQPGGQVDSRRGLPDSALLVGDRDDSGHGLRNRGLAPRWRDAGECSRGFGFLSPSESRRR
jgi:hypothetical protein